MLEPTGDGAGARARDALPGAILAMTGEPERAAAMLEAARALACGRAGPTSRRWR